ncbi:c-type cytochrome [Cyclobacterium sp. GBPx2]|uniref:C-type cytochrome n=2 Tax=Cyclobacterium plantarum TaxID=2716263 RepID=A0ABX0H5Y5_9BACT|nr:c-type cytochrome [Cyclobacterium plantarum]
MTIAMTNSFRLNEALQKIFGHFKIKATVNTLILFAFLSSCGKEEIKITEVDFEKEEFAGFVEPGFPFIATSMDARALGEGFPENNISARVLALQLGNEAYACFDTDMLRWTVAWTGDFMPMVTMAQVSYDDFHNKGNQLPTIGGDPKIATGTYPGWSAGNPVHADPRRPSPHPQSPPWGPISPELGRWNGIYTLEDKVVLSYQVAGIEIKEYPGSLVREENSFFTRSFAVAPSAEKLYLSAAEVSNGTRTEVKDDMVLVYQGESEEHVTALALSAASGGVKLLVEDDRYLLVEVDARQEELQFGLLIWKGQASDVPDFESAGQEFEVDIPEASQGGKPYWTEEILTQGKVSPDTAAFVTDQLTLPVPNPWKRNVRLVDLSFMGGEKAAMVTFEGDVWMVDGIDAGLERLSWTRYASGLYEPQSIEVVDGDIYVYGKDGITRLHDLNDDGVADFYENFSNLMAQSIETREWASDMVAAPEGGFYVAKFGALDMGPETSSPKSLMGFRSASHHDGSVLKISADGRSISTFASGFRGPYLGIHPEKGWLTGSDQQGHYMPSTPVMLIRKDDYFGVPATAHRDPIPEVTPPITWIPHNQDRSGVSQVWVTSDQMGPLNDQMIHLSYGRPGLFLIKIDSASQVVQGGASVIPGIYPAPTMNGAVNPEDGMVYITGFSLWGHNSETLSAFLRLRYTGKESLLPTDYKIRDGGVVLRFEEELDEEVATDLANYQVKRWNYLRTEKYGSGHYKLDGSVGEENLPVLEAFLSDDKKAVFLSVPNISKVMQMEIAYDLTTAKGTSWSDKVWMTVNEVLMPNLLAEGFSNINQEDLNKEFDPAMLAENNEAAPDAVKGKELFMNYGCIACHAIDDNNEGKIGPGVKGLYGTEREFKDGSIAKADEAYLKESIIDPGAKVVKGREGEMPSFLGVLSENDIDSIILYFKTLEN